MTVAKSGKGCNKERKDFCKMCGEITSGLCGVLEASLSDQSQSPIVDVRQHACTITSGETSSVFSKRDITPIMGACLNAQWARRTPDQTFSDTKHLADEKMVDTLFPKEVALQTSNSPVVAT